MLCLTLKQPWASLVASGAKVVETRSWRTHYRGTLAIHASKQFRRAEWETLIEADHTVAGENPFRKALERAGIRCFGEMPVGCILAVVEVVDCLSTGDNWSPRCTGEEIAAGRGWGNAEWVERLREEAVGGTSDEFWFGFYQPGRFGWFLSNVRRLPDPVPARGSLGLWRVAELSAPDTWTNSYGQGLHEASRSAGVPPAFGRRPKSIGVPRL